MSMPLHDQEPLTQRVLLLDTDPFRISALQRLLPQLHVVSTLGQALALADASYAVVLAKFDDLADGDTLTLLRELYRRDIPAAVLSRVSLRHDPGLLLHSAALMLGKACGYINYPGCGDVGLHAALRDLFDDDHARRTMVEHKQIEQVIQGALGNPAEERLVGDEEQA